MVRLNEIWYSADRKTINYRYSIESSAKPYLNANEPFYARYEDPIDSVPESIAVIPLVSSMITLAWFAGFDLEVPCLDKDFYEALEKIKAVFQSHYPDLKLTGKLRVDRLVENSISGAKTALLFSGGVDAFASYIRVGDQLPDLVTVLGADIEIADTKQWNEFVDFLDNDELLAENRKVQLEANLREFYSYKAELLLPAMGWWGKVQHGLALLGSVAPISYLFGYSKIVIASSYTNEIDISWGSMPELDNQVSWAGVEVAHDGYELRRQEKVDLIAEFAECSEWPLYLRVCYSELRQGFNCGNCEKCYRTMLGLILAGANPNLFGFEVKPTFYTEMNACLNVGSASKGMRYFWWELQEKAKSAEAFTIADSDLENREIGIIASGELVSRLTAKIVNPNIRKARRLFWLRHKFPWLPVIYRKLRAAFS